MSTPPDHIGKYRILSELGRGSSAIVYRAEDPFNDRLVAIKVEHVDKATDTEEAERFRKLFVNEASLAGKLNHPNIVAVYDAVVDQGIRYIVMEHVPGGSLKRYCVQAQLLPLKQVAMMVFKCARALDYAFLNGVIHRDLKPANILLDAHGEVKISDFGTAHIAGAVQTQLNGFLGSPAYMAPEQINEQPASAQSDIYSLGVVMFELLTGRLPYQADSGVAMIQKVLNEAPAPLAMLRPDLPARLIQIVARAMHKDLTARYATWYELAKDLIEIFPQLEALGSEISRSEKYSQLKTLRFFNAFRDQELWEVVRTAAWQSHARGQHLAQDDDAGTAFYIILSGQAKVTKDNRFLSALSSGDCFGDIAEISRPRSGQAVAITAVSEVQLIKLRPDQLDQLSEGCQLRFNKAFLQTLVERLALAK